MENNEDTRQMTVITEAIMHIEQELEYSSFLYEKEEGADEFRKSVIMYLASLLPKEEQSHIDFAAAYKTAVHYDPMIKSPRTVYHETFKPYTNEADPHK